MSIHEDLTKDLDVKTASDRNFGFVFAVVFLIVGVYPFFGEGGEVYVPGFLLSAAFLIVTIAKADLLAPLNKLWTKFGLLLQKIVSPIVLGSMFYLGLAPIGLLMRLSGKDLLQLKLDYSTPSYWIKRTPPGPSPESMTNQY